MASLKRRPFGELESVIMRAVWASDGPLSVREISNAISDSDEKAYTTVQTVTERLFAKGWLSRQRVGKAFVYSAARSADEYTAGLMEQALDASSDRPAALVMFAGHLSAEESAALLEALAAPRPPVKKVRRAGRSNRE